MKIGIKYKTYFNNHGIFEHINDVKCNTEIEMIEIRQFAIFFYLIN